MRSEVAYISDPSYWFFTDNIKVDTSMQCYEHGDMAKYLRQLKVFENLCHSYLTKWVKWYEHRCLQI
jgi:hypothetical protein